MLPRHHTVARRSAQTLGLRRMMSATFRFGAGDVHEFRVECDLIGGERYFVDDVLLEKRWSLSAGGDREFVTNGHRIRIVLRVTSKEVVSEAYVDGQLKVKELFPQLSRMRKGSGPVLFRVAVWILIAAVSFVSARSWLG
jgi:hypothetical protein